MKDQVILKTNKNKFHHQGNSYTDINIAFFKKCGNDNNDLNRYEIEITENTKFEAIKVVI